MAFAVILPTIMEVLDTSIVNVALPHMAGSLGADTAESTWILTSYLVSNAVVLPMTSWLSRRFGRLFFLMSCVIGFTAASVLCAISTSLQTMIPSRVLQGAAGGALQPLSQAILLENFQGRERGPAMAVWGMGIVVAPVVAPLLGGFLTENWSWHWIFLINVPVGGLALLAISAFVTEPPHAGRQRLPADALGIALLVLGLGALQIMLDKGQEWDWWSSPRVRALAAASAFSLLGLVAWESRQREPVLDLGVLRDRTYVAGILLMFVFGLSLYSSLALLPLFMQTLLGYSALDAGKVLSPRGLGVMATMGLAGILLRRSGPRWIMLSGFPLLIGACAMMGRFTLDASRAQMIGAMLVQGLGMGLVFVPLTTATMTDVAAERTTSATGLFNLMRNLGGSVGVALTQVLLQRSEQIHHLELVRHVNPYAPEFLSRLGRLADQFSRLGLEPGRARERALHAIARSVEQQAQVLAYQQVFWTLALALAAITPLVLLMRSGSERPANHSGLSTAR